MSKVLENKESSLEAWFDDFVSSLRSHQLQLETETASQQLKTFYEGVMSASGDELAKMNKRFVQKYFVERIILEYIKSIESYFPQKIAFDFNDSEVLVWAEIKDNSEELEKKLILAEATINAKYHSYGFDMNSIIVEESDNLEIPNHYKILKS